MVPDAMQRYKQLLFFAAKLKGFDEADRVDDNKVPGCVSQVWVVPRIEDGLVYFTADSDSQLTKGLAALLVEGLSGSTPKEIMAVEPNFVELLGLGQSPRRAAPTGHEHAQAHAEEDPGGAWQPKPRQRSEAPGGGTIATGAGEAPHNHII